MTNEAFEFSNKNIIILSPEPWGSNLISKHHIALTLAKWGNTIWFVAPFGNFSKKPVENPHSNIQLIYYKAIPGLNSLHNRIARLIARLDVQSLMRKIKKPVDIIWSFDPYQFQFVKLFNASISIYHPVDNHNTKLEKRIIKEVDLVLSNTTTTLTKFNHSHKYKIGHGVASFFFEPSLAVDIPGDFKIKVGYVGNLNNKFFDFDHYCRLAIENPNIGFYLIGPRGSSNLSESASPTFDWSRLDKLGNVFWLGQQPSSLIPSYIKHMDILLVLYKSDTTGVTVNPHKLLEYLSSGRLVITPQHAENESIRDLILEADSIGEIAKVFDHAVENLEKYLEPALQQKRIDFVATMTYEKRLKELEKIIQKLEFS